MGRTTTHERLADRFEIECEVGRGSSGILYKARELSSHQVVALKLIRTEPGSGNNDDERLTREGDILSRLEHPNIVRVFAHGRISGTSDHYVAMEWLAGEDLAQRSKRQALDLYDSVDTVYQVADALVTAHAAGVLHRDIKPANIFLTHTDEAAPMRAILVDFGVALSNQGDSTDTEAIVGTPAYMPPERARGDHNLSASSDIYSLGATLFELVTGRPPHLGPNAIATLARLVTTQAPRLSDLRSTVPGALTDLVERMLSTAPGERPQTALEVRDALLAIRHGLVRGQSYGQEEHTSLRLGSSATRLITSIVALGFSGADLRDKLLLELNREGADAVPLRHDSLVAHLGARLTIGSEAQLGLDLARRLAEAGARVGIASGRARIRALGTQSLHPVGEVVDRAAALAREATNAQVLADTTTSELARGSSEFRARGDGSSIVGVRLKRLHTAGGAPFVGREPELNRILSSIERSLRDRTATLTTVTGPAGIGKSRLRREVLARLSALQPAPAVVLQRSTAYGDRGALGAASDVLRGLTGLAKGASLDEATTSIVSRFGPESPRDIGAESCQILARLLSDQALGTVSDPDARDRLWLAMTDLILAVANQVSVLIALEDAQWADRESIAFFDHLLGRSSDQPLVLLSVMRPEFWPAHPNVFGGRDHMRLILRPISRRSTLALARAVLGDEASEELVVQIADQSSGVPLFAEELARVAARGGDTRHAATIEAAIQVSLDSLDEVGRDAVGRLSVFGLAGWDAGLGALGLEAPAQLLAELTAAEVLMEQESSRFAGAGEWMFKHALVREVAYKALGEVERRELHALAGRWLASVGEDAAVIAKHFELAEQHEIAARHYAKAARRALATHALRDALQMAEKALAFATTPEEGFERALCLDEAWSRLDPSVGERQTAIWALEENVYDDASQVRAQGARARYDNARGSGEAISERLALARDAAAKLELRDEEARCSAALAARLAFAGHFDEAEAEAHRLLKLAEHSAARSAAVDGWQTLAITHQTRGALTAALEARRNAAQAARAAGLNEREAQLTTNLGFALTTLGARQEARSLLETGLALASKIGSEGELRHAQMVLLGWAATFGTDKNLDATLAKTREEADRAALDAWTSPDRENLGTLYYRGCELFGFGDETTAARAQSLLRLSAEGYQRTDNHDLLPVAQGMWALAELRAGNAERAAELAEQAVELLEAGAPSLLNESPVYLALHEANLALGRENQAREAIERAMRPLLRRLQGLVGTPYAQLFLTELTFNADLVAAADSYGCLPVLVQDILERSHS